MICYNLSLGRKESCTSYSLMENAREACNLSLFLLCQHLQSLGSSGIFKKLFSAKESQGNNNDHLMGFTVAR